MGGEQKTSGGNNQEAERENDKRGFREIIDLLYDEGIQVGLNFSDMYSMDYYELQNTIEYRRKGMAYAIWKIASLTRHPMVKNFPDKPEEACPELYPKKRGIKMPDFLKEKYKEQIRGEM